MATVHYLRTDAMDKFTVDEIKYGEKAPTPDSTRKVAEGVEGDPSEIFRKAENCLWTEETVAPKSRAMMPGDVIEYDDRVVVLEPVGVSEIDW